MSAFRTLCDVELNKRERFAKPLVITQTVRLDLREFQKADWMEVHKYASDAQVVRFMSWGPNTEDETRRFIQKSIAYQKEKPRVNYSLPS